MQLSNNFILRLAVSIVLLMHSLPSIFSGGVNDFGNAYLNQAGFGAAGLPLAWTIKLSHIGAAICFMLDRFVKVAGFVTIVILITGIFMIHLADGWFVVGGGRNGVEFNFLMIAAILTLMFPKVFQSVRPL